MNEHEQTIQKLGLHESYEFTEGGIRYVVLKVIGGWGYSAPQFGFGFFVPEKIYKISTDGFAEQMKRPSTLFPEFKEGFPQRNMKFHPNEIAEEMLHSDQWIDDVSMTKNRPRAEVVKLLNEFIGNQKLIDGLTSLKDSKKHFLNWMNLQQGSKKQNISSGIRMGDYGKK